MNKLNVGNVILGEGLPKICISITGEDRETLLQEIRAMSGMPCQLIEWRADYMMEAMKGNSFWEMTRELLAVLGFLKSQLDKPLLFTIRTCGEGGCADIAPEDYFFINKMVADSGMADMIDIEAFIAPETDLVSEYVKYAGDKGNTIILSNHDFEKTPDIDDMVKRFTEMRSLGGDIVKLAVMPNGDEDVVGLLEAAAVTNGQYPEMPLVAISMGEQGISSRICAGQFGSVITFASGKVSSAPGQIDAGTLQGYLERYYK